LEGQVTLFLPLGAAICGWLPAGLQCTCPICCPMDAGPQAFTPGASSDGDPVNLATGGEEYAPPADFKIYNPIGPSISWARTYNSLSNTTENGFGGGWSHPLNICVFDSGQNSKQQQQQNSGDALRPVPGGGGATSYLVLANSAQIPFTLPSTAPTASNPSVACTVATGYPYLVSWNYDTPSGSTYYVITLPDRTKLVTMTRAYSAAQPFQNIFGTPELFITQIVDRVGNYINLQWALRNNGTRNVGGLSSVTDSSGNALLTLAYDSDARFVSATDRYGRSVYYTCARFSNQNVPPNINRQWNDELTQVSAVVATGTSNPPVNFSYGYQNYGNGEGSEMVPYLHTITVPSPTGTGTSTSTINYNSYDGYITSIVDANGNTRTYTPTQSNVTQVTVTNSQGQTVYSYSSTFSSNMSESKFVNSSGKTVYTKTYSDSNSPYGMSTYTDGNNRAWSYTYDKFTSPLTAKTPKGTITTYTRSYENFALGELTSYQVGTKTAASIAYNEPSGLVQSFSGPIPGQTGTGQTQTTSYTYDALGNVTQVTMPGNNAASTRTYTFGYTTDGTYTQAEGLHQPITVTDPLGNVTHLRYDARKNTLSRTDPSGNKTTFTYNLADQKHSVVMPATGQTGTGNESTVLTYLYVGGPLSQVNAYDESNNLVRTVNMTYGAEAELLARSGSVENTSIQYDALYHKVLVKDGNSNATSLAFDQNGNLTSISYPGASGANYDKVQFTSHDPVGNALTRVDGNGQTATYTYGDADGKLSAVAYSGNSQSNVSITYDAYDRQSASTDGAGSSSYTYDDRDNVLTSSRTYTGLSQQSMSFAYYPDGSRETMVNPAGTWTYTYDAAGRSTGLVSPAGTLSASYYANSWESGRTLPNGTATTYTYNAVGAPASIQTLTSGNQVIAQYGTFKYDGVNNPLGLSATFSGVPTQTGTTSYTYDSYDRLTNETSQLSGGYNESFACDPAANLTTVRGASQGFDSDDQITGASFAYDGNGSPTTYAGNSLAFDVEARLIGEGANWSAGYRADGLRAWKQTSSGKTYYLYDQGEPVVELNSSGAVTGVNVFAHDGLVARSQGGTWTYYAFDALGNVGQRLNSSQSVVSSSSYDSYGAESNNGTPSDTFGYRARFGYVLDRETGFYYCRNRYYDPARGRWLSRDPIGFFGGINLYAYGRSAPNASVDPSGHYGLVLAGAGAGGGTIVLGGAGGTGVLGTTVGAGPIGIGIDNATGGGWGRFWCRVLGQDCEGTNELPAPTPDELCRARDELGPEPDFPDPDNDNSCADLATTVCGGYSGDTFFACAELITSLCLASGGAMTPEEAAEIAESNFGIPEVEEPEVDLPPMLPG
jgi:RHS repeat-associated protein